MKKPAKFALERFFVALSDKTRLRLLNLMGKDAVCVCFFVEILGEPQPKISRQLAYLRRAGVVSARREVNGFIIALSSQPSHTPKTILTDVTVWLKDDTEMQRDRARLSKVCCAASPPVQLRAAPKPARIEASVRKLVRLEK